MEVCPDKCCNKCVSVCVSHLDHKVNTAVAAAAVVFGASGGTKKAELFFARCAPSDSAINWGWCCSSPTHNLLIEE